MNNKYNFKPYEQFRHRISRYVQGVAGYKNIQFIEADITRDAYDWLKQNQERIVRRRGSEAMKQGYIDLFNMDDEFEYRSNLDSFLEWCLSRALWDRHKDGFKGSVTVTKEDMERAEQEYIDEF